MARRVLEVRRGFLDADEQPTEAALRELMEETGFMCAPGSLLFLGPGVLSARAMLFAATDCQNGGQPFQDEIGIDERLWFPITEVRPHAVRIRDRRSFYVCAAPPVAYLQTDSMGGSDTPKETIDAFERCTWRTLFLERLVGTTSPRQDSSSEVVERRTHASAFTVPPR